MLSYGAITVILSYLDPLETLQLQLMNRFMYKVGVPRVQQKVKLVEKYLFFAVGS